MDERREGIWRRHQLTLGTSAIALLAATSTAPPTAFYRALVTNCAAIAVGLATRRVLLREASDAEWRRWFLEGHDPRAWYLDSIAVQRFSATGGSVFFILGGVFFLVVNLWDPVRRVVAQAL